MYHTTINYLINGLASILISPSSSLTLLSILDLYYEPSILYIANGLRDISINSPKATSEVLHELIVLLGRIIDSNADLHRKPHASAFTEDPEALFPGRVDNNPQNASSNNKILIVLLRLIISIIQKNFCVPGKIDNEELFDYNEDTSGYANTHDSNFYLRNFFTKRFQGTLSPTVLHIFRKFNLTNLIEEKLATSGLEFSKENYQFYISTVSRLLTNNFSLFEYISIKNNSKILHYQPKDYELEEIEYYSGVLLTFFSSCKPEFYIDYLSNNLFIREKDKRLPLIEFLHQLELLEFMISAYSIINDYFSLVWSIILNYEKEKSTESSIRQQLVIIYFSRGLKHKISSYPDRYIKYLDSVNNPNYSDDYYTTLNSNICKIFDFTYRFFKVKTVYDSHQKRHIKILDFHNKRKLVVSLSIFLCFESNCFSKFVHDNHNHTENQNDIQYIFLNSLIYYIRYCDARNMKLNAMYHEAACESFILLFGLSTCIFRAAKNYSDYSICKFVQKHLKTVFNQTFIESLRDDSNCDKDSYNNNLKFMDEMRISYIVFENSLLNLPDAKSYVFTLSLIESMLKTYEIKIKYDAIDKFLEDYANFCKSPNSKINDTFKPEDIQFFKDIQIKSHVIFIFINAFRIIQDTSTSPPESLDPFFELFYLPLLDYHLETYVQIIKSISKTAEKDKRSLTKGLFGKERLQKSPNLSSYSNFLGSKKMENSTVPAFEGSYNLQLSHHKPGKPLKTGNSYLLFTPSTYNYSSTIPSSQANHVSSSSSSSSFSSNNISQGEFSQYQLAQTANPNLKDSKKSTNTLLLDTSPIQSDIEMRSSKDAVLSPSSQSSSFLTIRTTESPGVNNNSSSGSNNSKLLRFYDDKINFARSIFNLKSDKLKHKLKRSSSSSSTVNPVNAYDSTSGNNYSIHQDHEKQITVSPSISSNSSEMDPITSNISASPITSQNQGNTLLSVTLVNSRDSSTKGAKPIKNEKIIKKSANSTASTMTNDTSGNNGLENETGKEPDSDIDVKDNIAGLLKGKQNEVSNLKKSLDLTNEILNQKLYSSLNKLDSEKYLISSNFDFLESYDDKFYRDKINDPYYICKSILSNIFSCIKLEEFIYKVLAYTPSIHKAIYLIYENIDPDYKKKPPTIYSINTQRILLNNKEQVSHSMLKPLLEAIACGFKDMDSELFQTARLATKMLISSLIPKGRIDGFNDTFVVYSKNFDLSNYLMLKLTESFLLNDARLSSILKVFSEEFQRKLFFMKNNIDEILKDNVYFGFKDTGFLLNQLEKLEEFLFYIICSPNLQVIKSAHNILKLVQEELSLFGYVNNNNNMNQFSVFPRKNLINIQKFISSWAYRDLFQEILSDDTTVVISSAILYRKKICKCLIKYIKKPTASLFSGWEMIFETWKELTTKQILKGNYSQLKTFEGCSVVLSAISGIIWDNSIKQSDKKRVIINSQILEFIKTNVKLLYAKNTHVQLVTQYVILEDIHPNSYKLVIDELNKSMHLIESKSKLVPNDTKFLLCDAILTFSKTIFKHSDELLIFKSGVDIVKFLKFVLMILKDDNSSMVFRTKIRACTILSQYFDIYTLAILGFLKLRNSVLNILIGWMEEALDDYFQKRLLNFDMLLYLEASKVVKVFTKELSLLHYSEESSLGVEEKKKEVIVDRYLKLIYSQVSKDTGVDDLLIASQLNKSFQNLVEGLGNLLNRNINIAIEKSVTLGFHSDYRIQLVFFKIFINALKNMDVSSESKQDYWETQLYNFLVENIDLAIAMTKAYSSSQDIDLVATSLIHIFGLKNKDLDIVVKTVEAELKPKSSALRLNTVASRMLYFFSKSTEGDKHLEQTVDKIMFELSSKHDYFDLNVEDENEKKEHIDIFMKYLTKLVNIIVSSKIQLPNSFKFICYKIRETYSLSFSDDPNVERNSINVVSSFIFLRYFCPSLMNPIYISERYSDDENMKVSLRFLAILLQGLATKSFLSSKNKWNLLLVDYKTDLDNLSELISNYLKEISKPITIQKALSNREIGQSSLNIHKDSLCIAKLLFNNILRVRSEYLNAEDFVKVPIEKKYIIWKEFDRIVNHLDPPLLISQYKIPDFVINDPKYSKIYDFMTRFSTIDTSGLLKIPVLNLFKVDEKNITIVINFYYYQKYHVDSILVAYIFFQYLVEHINKEVTIIIDLTGYLSFDKKNPLRLVQSVITTEMLSRISKVYLLNVSATYFKEIDSGNVRYLSDYEVISTLNEESLKNIDYSMICEHTMYIKNERKINVNVVQVYSDLSKSFIDAEFYIGTKHIHIGYVIKANESSLGKNTYLTEIYKIKDSNLIIPENKNLEKQAEFILIDKYKKSRRFLCKDRLYIIKMFYVAKSKTTSSYLESSPVPTILYSQEMRNISIYNYGLGELNYSAGDISQFIGYILNLTFYGILSPTTKIRNSSNELLILLTQKSIFRLNNIKKFYVPDQTVPDDLLSHIVYISENLAAMYPEITYPMFIGFFRLFDAFPENREKSIIFMSPWIQNIYPYIYRSTGNLGIEHTKDVIENICRVSRNFDYIALFGEYFWKELINNNFLIDILCDTVMYQVMQSYNLEEILWTKYIGLLTSFPTISLCANIVQRMIKLAQNIDPGYNHGEDSIAIKEVSILLKICLYCFFNNRSYYIKFFPELLFIVLIYYNIGPLSMKKDLYELAYSLFYVFKYDEKGNISSQDISSVEKLLEYIESDNVRFIYGVDSKSERFVQYWGIRSFISSDLVRFVSLFKNFMSFVDEFHDIRLRNIWIIKLSEYILNSTFHSTGKLSTRSIVLFGVLSSYGITEKFMKQCLPHFDITLVKRLPNNICVLDKSSIYSLFAITGSCAGLPLNIAILGWSIWSLTIRCLTRDAVAYEILLKCSISLIELFSKSMDHIGTKYNNADSLDIFFECSTAFDNEFKQLSRFDGFELDSENYLIFFCFILQKGLRVPSLKQQSISCFKRLVLSIKFGKNKLKYQFQNYFTYLLIFLKQQAFWELLVSIDSENVLKLENLVELDNNLFVPNFILEEIVKDDDKNVAFLIVLSKYFDSVTVENDERLKFLALINYICEHSNSLMKKIYNIFLEIIGYKDPENDKECGIRDKTVAELSIIINIFKKFSSGINVLNPFMVSYSSKYLRKVIKEFHIEGIHNNEFIDISDQSDSVYISKANERFIAKQKLVDCIYKKGLAVMEYL